MARADGKKIGPGVKGKGDGAGAMSELDSATLPANAVLSIRDKSRISGDRGRDGKTVQTEQYEDHVANRRPDERRDDG